MEKLSRKLSDLGGQLQVADNRLLSLQDSTSQQVSKDPLAEITSQGVMASVSNIESLIKNSSARNHHKRTHSRQSNRHYSSHSSESLSGEITSCETNKDLLLTIQSTIEDIRQSVQSNFNTKTFESPRFEYLKRESPSALIGEYSADQEEEFSEAEDKFVHLFRRITTPFKKVNKRLMSMATLQDLIETEIAGIKVGIETTNEELNTKLSEFISASKEISQEQNHLIEGYASNFASLQQCCIGQSADFNRFAAQAGSIVAKMDR